MSSNDRKIDKLILSIMHGSDGPATLFVMISRATELATRFDPNLVAEALHDALTNPWASVDATARSIIEVAA